MIYRLRVILDVREDVFRDIEIDGDDSFEELHNAIIQSFGLDGREMASFYVSDDDWNQGEEIALFDVSDGNGNIKVMGSHRISELLTATHQRMLYAYDFLNIKTFYIEVMSIKEAEEGAVYPLVVYSFGDTPDFTDSDMEEIDDPEALEFDDEDMLDDDFSDDDIFAGDDSFSSEGMYDDDDRY